MTRLEAQTYIENRLGQRTGLATRIQGELRAAQRHFEHKQFVPWFLRTTAVFATDEQFLFMPAGFLREVDDEDLLTIIPSTGAYIPLKKMEHQFIAAQDCAIGPGQPKWYTIETDLNQPRPTVNFFPQPMESYTYRMVYYRADAELLDDASENAWLVYAPDVLICQAGLEIAKALRSPEGTQLFAAGLLEATKDMIFSHTAQAMAGLSDLTMGG